MTTTRIRNRLVLITLAALWIAAFSPAVPAQEDEELPPEIQPKNCLMLPAAGRSGRSAIHTDAIEARIVAGTFAAPRVGDKVAIPGKSDVAWVSVEANDKGVFPVNRFVGGYAFFSVKLPEDETLILEASGHGLVYVNGEIRAGDPYGYGWLMLPVELREGENRFLFRLGRKPLKFKLVRSEKTVFFNLRDRTLPHAIVGQTIDAVAGVVVVNARDESLRGFALAVTVNGGPQRFQPVSLVTPLGFRKIVVPLRGPAPRGRPEDRACGNASGPARAARPGCVRAGQCGHRSGRSSARPDPPAHVREFDRRERAGVRREPGYAHGRGQAQGARAHPARRLGEGHEPGELVRSEVVVSRGGAHQPPAFWF